MRNTRLQGRTAASMVRSRFVRDAGRSVAPQRRCKRKRYAYGSRTVRVPELRCKVAGRVEYREGMNLSEVRETRLRGAELRGPPYVNM